METVQIYCYVDYLIAFKSYYVVWKLTPTTIHDVAEIWFKSYYVVWKRYASFSSASLAPGLNRTMQYGNPSLQFYDGLTTLFKSYYVVWKPQEERDDRDILKSLNRTMQYGNISEKIIYIGEKKV